MNRLERAVAESMSESLKVKESLPVEAIYTIHRNYIENEDEIISHRTTLFIATQGALLGASGYLLQQRLESIAKLCEKGVASPTIIKVIGEYQEILRIFTEVGAATSLIAFVSISAAYCAIHGLNKSWERVLKMEPERLIIKPEPPIIQFLPGIIGGGVRFAPCAGMAISIFSPIVLLLVWGWGYLHYIPQVLERDGLSCAVKQEKGIGKENKQDEGTGYLIRNHHAGSQITRI